MFFITIGTSFIYSQDLIESVYSEDPYLLKLIELAKKNNPDYLSLSHSVNISQYELERTKYEWVNNIRATGNLNEFSINPSRNQNNLFYPRYNFSVTVPMGIFIQQPRDTKIALENLKITKKMGTKLEQQMKLDIIKKYNHFLKSQELLQKQTELTDSELSNYLILEEKFKNNDAELNDLNEAERNYNRELFKQINFQEQVNSARLELETVIGAPLPPSN